MPKEEAGIDGFTYLSESQEFLEFVKIIRDLTGIAVGLCYPTDVSKGKPFYQESELNPIRQLIRSNADGRAACNKTDSINCQQAYLLKHAVRYYCHAGLVDFAIPIYLKGNHVATISCGQVLAEAPSQKGFAQLLRHLKKIMTGTEIDTKALRKAYLNSTYMSPEKLDSTFKLLTLISEYFCEMGYQLNLASHNHSCPEIHAARQYIQKNSDKPIKLREVADYVGFSQGYFSRLFSKVTGDSFTSYVQKTRMERAKKLLTETNLSVTEIAFQAGFSSIQCFYQTFHKAENCSPSQYRKNREKTESGRQ